MLPCQYSLPAVVAGRSQHAIDAITDGTTHEWVQACFSAASTSVGRRGNAIPVMHLSYQHGDKLFAPQTRTHKEELVQLQNAVDCQEDRKLQDKLKA